MRIIRNEHMYQPILDSFCALEMHCSFIGSSPKIKNAMKNHNIIVEKQKKLEFILQGIICYFNYLKPPLNILPILFEHQKVVFRIRILMASLLLSITTQKTNKRVAYFYISRYLVYIIFIVLLPICQVIYTYIYDINIIFLSFWRSKLINCDLMIL